MLRSLSPLPARLVALLGLLGCAPALGPYAGAGPSTGSPRTAQDDAAVSDGGPVLRAEGRCPVGAPNADVVLGRVEGDTLTGCDVYVAWHRVTRVGLRDDDLGRLFGRALRDALFAAEARRVGLGPTGAVDLEIERVLADALVRQEALEGMPAGSRPAAEPATPDGPSAEPGWVRVRALVLPSRPAALAALAALGEGQDFVSLVPQSIEPNARRDQGDLGMVPVEGNAAVPAAVARVVHGLAAPGDVHPVPLEVTRPVTVMVRRRARTRRVSGWWVVQLTDRAGPGEGVGRADPAGGGSRRVRDRYLQLRAAARQRWAEALGPTVREAIDPAALQLVRVRTARE